MGLLKFLSSAKEARRVFGKKELKIIEKQLLGINLTQSEKNRLSRDIRQKFEFIRKASKFSEEFKLKKGAEIKKLIEESKEIILNDVLSKKIKEIILFGSFLENKFTFSSDVDIAVKFSNITSKQALLFRKRIQGIVNSRMDIQVYKFLDSKIKKEIDNKGKVLYKNEDR
ncbi:MAG: nucleotidyltransferase domain-containing protein [Candidatus Nanoarchaeia archaeon]|nr:nucleotidyltransferase domain-containing protein [Candidatus Nanoarchaeia archaeon]